MLLAKECAPFFFSVRISYVAYMTVFSGRGSKWRLSLPQILCFDRLPDELCGAAYIQVSLYFLVDESLPPFEFAKS